MRNCDPWQWRSEDLKRAVLARGKRPLVVEGCMALAGLNVIGRKPDFLVYVIGEGSDTFSKPLNDDRARYQPQKEAQFQLDGFKERLEVPD
jgi:hypothetical protein